MTDIQLKDEASCTAVIAKMVDAHAHWSEAAAYAHDDMLEWRARRDAQNWWARLTSPEPAPEPEPPGATWARQARGVIDNDRFARECGLIHSNMELDYRLMDWIREWC